MRMLASAPLFSLWTEVKAELEQAADELDRMKLERRQMQERIRSLEGSEG